MIFLSKKIGKKLKQARESMGLSIEDIARRTRIDQKSLISIENGEFDQLSSPIYVRSYIRSYASIVGENSQLLLQSILADSRQSLPKSELPTKRRLRNIPFSEHTTKNASTTLTQNSHKVTLEGEDSPQIQVPQFIEKKSSVGTFSRQYPKSLLQPESQLSNQNELYLRSVAATSEMPIPSRRVTLPMNLPEPRELGIKEEVKITATDITLPSRRSAYKNRSAKESKNYGRIYTWVLIVAATLLTIAIICSYFFYVNPFAQGAGKMGADKESIPVIQPNSQKPILRELQTGIHSDRYEVVHADKIDLRIRAKKGASSFEIREKEVNPPIHKGEVLNKLEFTSIYRKTIWLKLLQPDQVEVTVNGFPLKTGVYTKEKDYVITLLQ